MTNLVIRESSPGDKPAIQTVTLAAYEQYSSLMGEQIWSFYRQNILETLADPGNAYQFVAEQDGTIIGTVLLYPPDASSGIPASEETAEGAEVRLLGVDPQARGLGAGRLLMQKCIEPATADGFPVITLHTTDLMAVAMRMYEAMGFVRDEAKDFHPTPEIVVKAYRMPLDGTQLTDH